MTEAVVVAAGARIPWVLERLRDQLTSLEINEIHVVDPADGLSAVAAIARRADGGVVVAAGDIVTHREALAGLLGDPRIQTGVLVTDEDVEGQPRVRSTRGRVESAASSYHSVHDSTATFLGVLKVAPSDVETLADAAERLATLSADAGDAPALLTVGMVRAGVHVKQSYRRELFWARPADEEQLEQARRDITGYDEDRVLLESAVKSVDGFFTTFFESPYSKYIARWAARRGLNPNQVTTVSMAVGILAAAAFATGERWGLVAGALLLQLAFTLDCVDGQLARYTRTFSKFGAWLDSVFDRGKEYVVYAGLAIGASHAGDPVWLLAGAALTLQTVRHAMDFAWGATQQQEIGAAPQPPLDQPSDRAPKPAGPAKPKAAPARPSLSRRLLRGWERLNRWPGMLWVKRVLAFPIGERFAAISVAAAVSDARTTFIVVLAWGGLATAYGLAGRLLRSMR